MSLKLLTIVHTSQLIAIVRYIVVIDYVPTCSRAQCSVLNGVSTEEDRSWYIRIPPLPNAFLQVKECRDDFPLGL